MEESLWVGGWTDREKACVFVSFMAPVLQRLGQNTEVQKVLPKAIQNLHTKKNVNSSHRRRQEKPWPRLIKAGHRGRHTISNPFGPAQNLWAIGWRVKVLMKDGMVGGTMYQSLSQMVCAVQRNPQSTAHCVLSTAELLS